MSQTAEAADPVAASWQSRPIEDLPVPAAAAKMLHARGFHTIGFFYDEMMSNPGASQLHPEEEQKSLAFCEDLLAAEDAARRPAAEPGDDGAEPPPEPAPAADLVDAAAPAAEVTVIHTVIHNDPSTAATANSPAVPPVKPSGYRVGPMNFDAIVRAFPVMELYEIHREVEESRLKMEATKASAKAAKEEYEAAVLHQHQFIGEHLQPNLFNQPAPAPAMTVTDDPEADLTESAGPRDDDAGRAVEECWRLYPIERLEKYGLPKGVVEKLREGVQAKGGDARPIVTVGDLSDYQKPREGSNGYVPRLIDIKGVGKTSAEKIELANLEFWKAWPNGERDAFAREKGLLDGTDPAAGAGSEDPGPGDDGAGGGPAPAAAPEDNPGPNAPDGAGDWTTGPRPEAQ